MVPPVRGTWSFFPWDPGLPLRAEGLQGTESRFPGAAARGQWLGPGFSSTGRLLASCSGNWTGVVLQDVRPLLPSLK